VINSMEQSFLRLTEEKGYQVAWKQECVFARQQIQKNDFSFKVATNNPGSLQDAILNVAAIGISLNPALAHAYLVPRDGAIYLDISFKGLVKIATESGAIAWAKTELVYGNDKFTYNGPATPPTHEADVFSERGSIVGGYCIAKLPSGDTLIEIMKIDEIEKVRSTSKAAQKNKGPWADWFEEMAKKTITKRASKSWPQTENRERLDTAIQALHESEGTAYTLDQQAEYMSLVREEDAIGLIAMQGRVSENVWSALFNSFEKGKKTEGKDRVRMLESKGFSELEKWAFQIGQSIEDEDWQGALEIYNDLPRELIAPRIGEEATKTLEELTKAAA